MMDEYAFHQARALILEKNHNDMGIGTLSEKTVHGILKNYYEPDRDHQEVALCGYVADIFRDGNVIEIQTANFNKMRDKLSVFLNLYNVKIVYPVAHVKYINIFDKTTGESVSRRRSPKVGSPYDAFYELYKIKNYLTHPNLSIDIVMLDLDEYRFLEVPAKRRRKNFVRYDRIPYDISSVVELSCVEDYMSLIPVELGDEFTSKEYAKVTHLSMGMASLALNVLTYIGTTKVIGRKGRAYLYSVKDN